MTKSILTLVLTIFLGFGFISCGDSDSSQNAGDQDNAVQADTDAASMADTANNPDTDVPCTSSGNWTKNGSLEWSDLSKTAMIYSAAKTYCENLCGRMPTISELRTLVQNCPASETGGACGVTDTCPSCYTDEGCKSCDGDSTGKYSKLGDANIWLLSATMTSTAGDYVWHLSFQNGGIGGSTLDNGANVRCVRQP